MKENLIIYACKAGATSARELQEELKCRYIGHAENENVREIPLGTLVVNYGFGYMPEWANGQKVRYLNDPRKVSNKISKVAQIKKFVRADVPTLELTTIPDRARDWLNQGFRVLARVDDGKDGEGIRVLTPAKNRDGNVVPYADFYTKEFKKVSEFRVHVFNGKVIDLVQRKQGKNWKEPDSLEKEVVRSWGNGWIFAHYNKDDAPYELMRKSAIEAVAAVELDFGAVDILVDARNNIAVCEVNSAPGLIKDETINAYVKAIEEAYVNG
jgi:hypothetical protein